MSYSQYPPSNDQFGQFGDAQSSGPTHGSAGAGGYNMAPPQSGFPQPRFPSHHSNLSIGATEAGFGASQFGALPPVDNQWNTSLPSSSIDFYSGSGSLGGTPGATTTVGGMSAFGALGNMGLPAPAGSIGSGGIIGGGGGGAGRMSGGFEEDEPPLLEELGINPAAIVRKTKAALLPLRAFTRHQHIGASGDHTGQAKADDDEDSDLAGPLVFCLALGVFLMLQGKLHFGYIYGFGVIGCGMLMIILNLMSLRADASIGIDRTMSIMGYGLLPIVILAAIGVFVTLKGVFGTLLTLFAISWCTLSAVGSIERALDMRQQRWLVAYPVVLLYASFALLAIF